MIGLELAIFALLAVLCNTVFPVPFDPVLIYFGSRHSPFAGIAFALVGSVCAGVAGAGDTKILSIVNRRVVPAWMHNLLPHWTGRRLYVLAFLCALLPVPFSLIRLAVLRQPPPWIPYALAVASGRLPRYMLTLFVWRELKLPDWISAGILLAAMVFTTCRLVLRCRENASRALADHREDFSRCTRASSRGAFGISRFVLRK